MRLAPGIRHDKAALRPTLETFLETIAVIWRNDQCPAFGCSCRYFEGEGGQNPAEEKKHKAKQLAAAVGASRYFGNRQDRNRHGNLKNWGEPGYLSQKRLKILLMRRQEPTLKHQA
jgi:hypothetical protein